MEFTTERLLLRPFIWTDLEHIQRYATRPEFYRYLPISEQTPKTVAEFLQDRIDEQGVDGRSSIHFALVPHRIGQIIGTIRIEVRSPQHKAGDLGFALDSDYWRRGYMTEALIRVIDFGFNELNLHRIWATADIENVRSWQLMARVGMTREGLLRDDKLMRGRWRSSYLYSIIAGDPLP